MTHELSMRQHNEEVVKKKKTIALKSTVHQEEESDYTGDDDEDEELALITRKFKRFMKKKNQGMRRRPQAKGEHSKDKDKEQPIICYECKRSKHIKVDCPQLKKAPKKLKKKTMMATWSDSADSSFEEDTHEEVNLFLKLYESEINTKLFN